jgi:hypothetical protein
VTYVFPTEFSAILTLYTDRVNLNSGEGRAVVAGASLRGYGFDVLGDVTDAVDEKLTGMVMLKESLALLLTLMVVFMEVDGESVVLSPACDTPRSSVRVANNQKLGWGHRNSILPRGHSAVWGRVSVVCFSSCW